jgi:hypothetical protein
VEENVDATVIRFDETKPLILIEHLNFASWHVTLKVFLCCQFRTDMRRKQGRGVRCRLPPRGGGAGALFLHRAADYRPSCERIYARFLLPHFEGCEIIPASESEFGNDSA